MVRRRRWMGSIQVDEKVKRVVRQGFGAAYERFWRFGRVVEGI